MQIESKGIRTFDEWEFVSLNLKCDKTWQQVYELLCSSYGGSLRSYYIQYDADFLRSHVFNSSNDKEAITLGVVNKTSKEIVAFVAATFIPVLIHGEPEYIALVDFWCAKKEVRGIRVAQVLIQHLMVKLQNAGALDGCLFTGLKHTFPKVRSYNKWVRVIDVNALQSIGLLGENEVEPDYLFLQKGYSISALSTTDLDTARLLFHIYNQSFDIAWHFANEYDMEVFLPGNGVKSWVILDEKGEIAAWFSFHTTVVLRDKSSNLFIKIAKLRALGARDTSAAIQALTGAALMAGQTGNHLFDSGPNLLIAENELYRLGFRPSSPMYIYTYGDVMYYQNKTMNIPFA